MLRRRTPQVLIGTAIIGLGATGLAAPAQAEEILNCTVGGNTEELEGSGPFDFENHPDYKCQEVTVSNSTVALTDIEVFTDTNGDGTFDADVSAAARAGYTNAQTGVRISYTGGTTASKIIAEFRKQITGTPNQTFEITLSSGGGGGGGGGGGDEPSGDTGSSALVSGPGPHVQQFGMPESGTCDEAAGAAHNWAGVASGGWGESWAQWANDGAGGAVCSRTLVYNASQGAWEVN